MHKATVVWGDGSTCVFVRIIHVPKASKVKTLKKGEGRTETKDLSCSSKVGIYMLGRYMYLSSFFFTEMVISSSQRGTSPSIRVSIFQLGRTLGFCISLV